MKAGFEALGLRDELVAGLAKMGITVPTAIQREMIGYVLDHQDVVGESQTGSGKTLAYLLPLFEKIQCEKKENQVMVLAPTHELVIQIEKVIRELAEASGMPVKSTTIIGNVNIDRQIEKLREKPQIIVGTPGRLLELIKKKKISAHTIKTIVIDEGDRLLDRNNAEGVKAVIKTTLKDRQLVLVSATVPERIKNDASSLMKEPIVLRVKESLKVTETISHWYILSERREKADDLRRLIHAAHAKKAIVFVNVGEVLESLEEKLKSHGMEVYGLHGAARKDERKTAMDAFRSGTLSILLASDIAARGLDIGGVTHVLNYELPEKASDYLHRTGRTGRQGAHGVAISLVTLAELESLTRFSREGGFQIQEKALRFGQMVDVDSRDVRDSGLTQ